MATILVIDDDPGIRRFLRALLGFGSHRVLEAANGCDALAIFQNSCPDLILADLVMPGMDGFEFFRQLRNLTGGGQTTPVIIYSGLGLDDDGMALAGACGVHCILEKPASPQTILDSVAQALQAPSVPVQLPEWFERDHLRLLADQLTRKVRELEEEVAQRKQVQEILQAVSRRVIEVQESERRHLAHELHDEIGQVLSAISVNLKVVLTKVNPDARVRIHESIDLVDRAVEQVRNLSLDLRPAVLDDRGLEAALRWFVSRLAVRTSLKAHFSSASTVQEIPCDLRNACFRVAQEALTNVVRQAEAHQVWIQLQGGEGEIRMEIKDDGIGFDVGAARNRGHRGQSLGLLAMQERIELLGGRLTIDSRPGQGTSVHVRIPIAENECPPVSPPKGRMERLASGIPGYSASRIES